MQLSHPLAGSVTCHWIAVQPSGQTSELEIFQPADPEYNGQAAGFIFVRSIHVDTNIAYHQINYRCHFA